MFERRPATNDGWAQGELGPDPNRLQALPGSSAEKLSLGTGRERATKARLPGCAAVPTWAAPRWLRRARPGLASGRSASEQRAFHRGLPYRCNRKPSPRVI